MVLSRVGAVAGRQAAAEGKALSEAADIRGRGVHSLWVGALLPSLAFSLHGNAASLP